MLRVVPEPAGYADSGEWTGSGSFDRLGRFCCRHRCLTATHWSIAIDPFFHLVCLDGELGNRQVGIVSRQDDQCCDVTSHIHERDNTIHLKGDDAFEGGLCVAALADENARKTELICLTLHCRFRYGWSGDCPFVISLWVVRRDVIRWCGWCCWCCWWCDGDLGLRAAASSDQKRDDDGHARHRGSWTSLDVHEVNYIILILYKQMAICGKKLVFELA